MGRDKDHPLTTLNSENGDLESGIEAINVYGGPAYVDIRTLFQARGLDIERFDNLMMEKKSVGLPCDDPVTNGVNAARPIIDQMSDGKKDQIEMLITASESGLDFGKSLSTYIHQYLGLSRNCRLFEIKQACYGGTAALQTANHFIRSGISPGAKGLVIATDEVRAMARNTYAEPSQATGAAAMLISDQPEILEIDPGAYGCCSYEVMDTCRPMPDVETGDPDLSLLSYLDCLEGSYEMYAEKVSGADFRDTFDFLAFHTPFAGMVKGAHRKMMRRKGLEPELIEADFQKRVAPSLSYCVQVGNTYSASLYFGLCSLIDCGKLWDFSRVGLFSYGSGCSSEFYSGIVTPISQKRLAQMRIKEHLASRFELTMDQYDLILDLNGRWPFGIREAKVDLSEFSDIYAASLEGRGLLVLKQIKDYHREYGWS